MKRFVFGFCVLGILMVSGVGGVDGVNAEKFDWAKVEGEQEKAAYILKGLKAWRKADEKGEVKKLRVVYFYPKDRKAQKNHVKRWDEIMKDIQVFYRTEMKHLGYGDVTLGLEKENGLLKLHEVVGSANDDGTYTYRSGGRIIKEVRSALSKRGIDMKKETLLIVCGLSRTEDKKVTIYSPYYGMGANHQRGICFVMDSDWLTIGGLRPDKTKTTLMVKEHRGYERFSLARFNTTYIGGTIHELGHGLSLPHNHATREEAKRGTALMGAGNYTYRKEWRNEGKGSFLTHAHAIRLLVHPLFSGITQDAYKYPGAKLQGLTIDHVDGKLVLKGKLKSEIKTAAMIAYNDGKNRGQTRFQVNNDYDATTWTSVVNPDGEFRISIGDLKNGVHQIRLLSVHANGAVVTWRMHYERKDGKIDLTKTRAEIKSLLKKE